MSPLIPTAHFFDNPERAHVRISPDGSRLAWLAPRGGLMNIWLQPRSGGDAEPITDEREQPIRTFFFTRDGSRIVFPKDGGGDEIFHLYAIDLERPEAEARSLTPFTGVKAGVIALPRETPKHILVSLNRRDPTCFDAYRLTIATGELTLVGENPGAISSWLADRLGVLRAAVAQTTSGDSELLVRDDESSPFRVVAEFANEDGGEPHAFTPGGNEIYCSSARGSDLARLVAIDVGTGAERTVDADGEADLGGPILSGLTGELLGAAYLRDRLVVHTFDERFARDFAWIQTLHPGDPTIVSQDADETVWVVSFDDDRDAGATFLCDRASREATFLHRPRPWLEPHTLATMTPVKIPSRDGFTLHSYLTLPNDVTPTGLPMVLVVHGGPWGRDSWGYQPEVQFLANRGYAVLQVNYRGSTGFGKRFTHAAEREFAGKMHDDLVDGVEWAIGEGVADRARIGIYGGSYGGYAALVGVTFTPDLFAAAVSVVGPSNLVTLIRSFPSYWRPFLEGSWFRFVGDPDDPEEYEELVARSPLTHVDRITTPLLVAQGANDPRVTKQESDQIVDALRERGVPVEYIVKEGEGHGFMKPENRLELYGAVERFFGAHLGGLVAT